MKLNKTLAVALHRAMWTDMQTELGDNPSSELRKKFKVTWIEKYFPNEHVKHNCFLCEYAYKTGACPIRWPEGHCAHPDFSCCTAPISEILILPEKGLYPTGLADVTYDSYYKFREELLSKASGIPGSAAIDDHVKAIQKKAVEDDSAQKASTFLAVAETSDAFKQYVEEKMEPLKQTNDQLTKRHIAVKDFLAQESGLDHDKPVSDHIEAIKQKAKAEGYDTAKEYLAECSGIDQNELLFDHIRAIKEKAVEDADSNQYIAVKKYLAKESGLNRDRPVAAHIQAIQEKAVDKYFEERPGAKLASMDVDQAFKQYANEQKAPIFHALAEASGLSAGNESVKTHISKIRDIAFQDGKDHERDRIMDKIGEMLNDKSTGKTANS